MIKHFIRHSYMHSYTIFLAKYLCSKNCDAQQDLLANRRLQMLLLDVRSLENI